MDALEAFGELTSVGKIRKYDADLEDENTSLRDFAFKALDGLDALTV